MKNILLIVPIAIALCTSSCKKEAAAPAPRVDFSIGGNQVSEYKMGTNDKITLQANAALTETVAWDFGNGTTSSNKDVELSYPKSGTYNVKLTITNKEGQQASISKKVVVMDRVLKKIIIKNVYWDTTPANIDHFNYVWPQTSTADVFVRFQQLVSGDDYIPNSGGLLAKSPVLYISPVVKNMFHQTQTPTEITITDKVLINKDALLNRSMVITLVAKDADGKYYNLVSSLTSGSNVIMNENINKNTFTASMNIFSTVELIGDFE